MPWVLYQFEDKLNKVYQGQPLENFDIRELDCKSQVVNQFFDYMISQDLSDDSFKYFALSKMRQ